ncbi:MAG: NTP transferase domain-containing protein, partial [Microcystaceae cyanobacterium]
MTDFPQTNLTAIILAGGQSSRMGQDKALLNIDGMPLLTRTCKLAQTVAQPVYVVTPWIERYSAIAPAGCELIMETWPPHSVKSPGPLWAFTQVLPLVKTEWSLLIACDLPYLTADFLQKLVRQLIR